MLNKRICIWISTVEIPYIKHQEGGSVDTLVAVPYFYYTETSFFIRGK